MPGGVQTLSLGRIPKPACRALERLLGVGDVYAIGFAWEDFHYGGVFLGLPREDGLKHTERSRASSTRPR